MKRFRVAIIDPVGVKAGLDHYDSSLAIALNESGVPARVFSNFRGGIFVQKVFRFSFDRDLLNLFLIMCSFVRALIICKWRGAEVIILHVFHSSLPDRLFCRLVRLFHFRLFIIFHDVESLVSKNSRPEIIAQMADRIVVHNNFTAMELKRRIHESDHSKISNIPHGHFCGVVKPVSNVTTSFVFEDDKIYLLFFGMIKKSKGLDIILESMIQVPEKVHLIVAGRCRDTLAEDYIKMVEQWRLEARVQMKFNYISNEERNLLFTKCHIAVLPYQKIYQSGIMLLAMSYGIPVIASDLPGNREIMENFSGEMFKSGDAKSLAERINLLAFNKELMHEKAHRAKEYVMKHHDWKLIGDSFKNLFN